MGIFITILLSVAFIFLSIKQILRNQYGPELIDEKVRLAPMAILSTSAGLLANLCVGGIVISRITLHLSLCLFPLYFMSLSMIPARWATISAIAASSLEIAMSVAAILNVFFFHVHAGPEIFLYLTISVNCLAAFFFLYAVYRRIADLRLVMRTGTVWSMINLSVDSVYMVFLLLISLAATFASELVTALLQGSLIVALSIRFINSSVFVILTDHERRIVESMKLSHVDYTCDNPGINRLYDNIYERVLKCFETRKPYLDHELTINDIVDVVYTNKQYISKAISHCTGRNFCQFVNYYRVTYAVEMFRNNPHIKVLELADMSGFNSPNSFNSAFKLYMGEKPSDWCRKERARLLRKK
jgi:AraC-like DNA-binding protein